MLREWGWRLINNPNSLCARVLKERYYPNTDFLLVTRKKHANHTWCAIIKDVHKRGLIRRICNGNTTDIWKDRWLPDHYRGLPITCHTLKYFMWVSFTTCSSINRIFREFLDFSGNYSIYPRARSISIWKALNFFFMSPKYFFWNPRDPNYLPSFPRNFWDSSGYSFRGLKYLSELF
jgi:hypothetical protein